MDIKPITTKRDYRAVLKEIEALMNARAHTSQGERLNVLVTRIEAYEAKHHALQVHRRLRKANAR